jgi:hypothetical protein
VKYTQSIEDIDDPEHIQEVVKEEITAMYPKDRAGTSYDPFRGQTIGVVHGSKGSTGKVFLLFPTGELGHHLSKYICTCPSEQGWAEKNADFGIFQNTTGKSARSKGKPKFTPCFKSLVRHKSEILQVCTSDVVSPYRQDCKLSYVCTEFQLMSCR